MLQSLILIAIMLLFVLVSSIQTLIHIDGLISNENVLANETSENKEPNEKDEINDIEKQGIFLYGLN
tara:strand:- start:366 stop:566 length:201 start_codon:yes stop_codon:yes gene_type:complete